MLRLLLNLFLHFFSLTSFALEVGKQINNTGKEVEHHHVAIIQQLTEWKTIGLPRLASRDYVDTLNKQLSSHSNSHLPKKQQFEYALATVLVSMSDDQLKVKCDEWFEILIHQLTHDHGLEPKAATIDSELFKHNPKLQAVKNMVLSQIKDEANALVDNFLALEYHMPVSCCIIQ